MAAAEAYPTVIAPSLTYIESDFADADETLREYRTRTHGTTRASVLRRVRRQIVKTADGLGR